MNKNNHNRIKFIGLPRDLDIDKEIDKRVNEVYGTCPYCGENDNVKFYSVEDECVKRNCSEHFSVSDFEIEELMLNGKKPRSKRDKVFKWARMLFYCDTCGCAWSSEKYPLRIGNDQEVVQDIMEHVINGAESPIMASIQNKIRIGCKPGLYIPPPENIPKLPDYIDNIYDNSKKIASKVVRIICDDNSWLYVTYMHNEIALEHNGDGIIKVYKFRVGKYNQYEVTITYNGMYYDVIAKYYAHSNTLEKTEYYTTIPDEQINEFFSESVSTFGVDRRGHIYCLRLGNSLTI